MEEMMSLRRFYQEVYLASVRANPPEGPYRNTNQIADSVATQAVEDLKDWAEQKRQQGSD